MPTPRPTYTLLDHTADCGIRVTASTCQALYQEAAMALTELIAGDAPIVPDRTHRIEVTGLDAADLMVNWLREILYLFAGNNELVASVDFDTLEDHRLVANVLTDPYSHARHGNVQEIKAVTYHHLKVAEGSEGWEATLIFDV